MVSYDMTIIWPWSDHGRLCLLSEMMVMAMGDLGQIVMVIPWSMMAKSDILTMIRPWWTMFLKRNDGLDYGQPWSNGDGHI